jgi:hypothetical protein
MILQGWSTEEVSVRLLGNKRIVPKFNETKTQPTSKEFTAKPKLPPRGSQAKPKFTAWRIM